MNYIDVLTTWKGTCDQNAQHHEQCRIVMRFRNLALSIPAILLSTLSGITNLSNLTSLMSDDFDKEVVQSLSGTLSLIAATLFALHRYLTLPELQKEHAMYSNAYTRLANEIHLYTQLVSSRERTYRNTEELLKDVKHRLDILIDMAPPLLPGVITRARQHDDAPPQQPAKMSPV